MEIDDSETVQTARKAKELLDRLAEYKPLAKVEELTEQNYNQIDNVLNNGAEKKEQEQSKGRISIKEKLAEKKAVIDQQDRAQMLENIKQVMPHIKDSDMEELAEQVLGKLQSMTGEEFAEVSLEVAEEM